MPEVVEPSAALRSVHEHVELMYIRTRELYCVREPIEDPDESPHFSLQVDLADLEDLEEGDPRPVRYGLKLELETSDGRTRVVVEGGYSIPREHAETFNLAVSVEYANHVALMALLPYVRQTLADMSSRVFDNQILMPVFMRGELTFPVPSGE